MLKGGDPEMDCGNPTYSNKIDVSGWYVWDYFYVGRQWVLQVDKKDMKKILSKGYEGTLRLTDASPELEKKLASANSKQPITLILRGLSYYCEGSPSVSIKTPEGEKK